MSHAKSLLERLEQEFATNADFREEASRIIADSREARRVVVRLPGLVPAGQFFADVVLALEANKSQ